MTVHERYAYRIPGSFDDYEAAPLLCAAWAGDTDDTPPEHPHVIIDTTPAGIRPEVQVYKLDEANKALTELHAGHIRGAKVLAIGDGIQDH